MYAQNARSRWHRAIICIYEDVFFGGGGEGLFLLFALKYKFYYLDEPLVVMREHAKNAGKRVKSNTNAHNHLMKRILGHKELPKDAIPHIQKHSSYFKMNTACGFPIETDSKNNLFPL